MTDQANNTTPPTNQGGRREKIGNHAQIFVHLDWLSYTVPFATSPAKQARRALLPMPEFRLMRHWGEGLGSYNTVIETQCGALLAWHPEHPEFKILASLNGSSLQNLGARGVTGRQLIEYALVRKARITRADIALDLYNTGAKISEIREVFEAGEAITQARAGGSYKGIKHEKGKQGGETLYIGSPASERQLRIYDKAAEQEKSGDWIRIELVSRKSLAHLLAEAIARRGVPDAGKQAIRQFFRLPSDKLVAGVFGWAFGGDTSRETGDGSPRMAVREGYPVINQRNRG